MGTVVVILERHQNSVLGIFFSLELCLCFEDIKHPFRQCWIYTSHAAFLQTQCACRHTKKTVLKYWTPYCPHVSANIPWNVISTLLIPLTFIKVYVQWKKGFKTLKHKIRNNLWVNARVTNCRTEIPAPPLPVYQTTSIPRERKIGKHRAPFHPYHTLSTGTGV